MNDALGLIEITGLAASMVVLDALDKASRVRLVQVEMNDQLGALVKIAGDASSVAAAVDAAEATAGAMHAKVVSRVINAPAAATRAVATAGREYNAMLGSEVVFIPGQTFVGGKPRRKAKDLMAGSFALGFIETQGLTAVLEALDVAAKAAAVEVVGREKLGGGYVTVILKGDVAAVQAGVDAARARVESLNLGKIIATHVIPRPSEAVLSILPTGS